MKKEKKLLFIVILLFIVSALSICTFTTVNAATDIYYEPITPNGTIVPYQKISTEMSTTEINNYIADEQQYVEKGAIKLDDPTNKYNSHSFAWYNQNYETNNYTISNDNVMKYFEDGSYIESDGNVGDIICYWRIKLVYNDTEKSKLNSEQIYLANSGIIKSLNGEFDPNDLDTLKNITVVSKWGKGELYEHAGNNTPYYYDSIHGKSSKLDILHFENVSNRLIDDALFYVTVYSPKIDTTQTIKLNGGTYTFEKSISNKGYAMYKLNVLNSGKFDFITETNHLTDIRIYNSTMNLIYDNEEVVSSTESSINASLDEGVYYLRVSFKDSYSSGSIRTKIKRVIYDLNLGDSILADYTYSGSEVYLNDGIPGESTITEGFTRYLFLNPSVAPSTSRLDYDWYSSDPNKAMITQYGTLLALNGDGRPQVTITAIYKWDKAYVFTKTFTILNDNETYESSPINIYQTMTVQKEKKTLITLPGNAPYNYNQYYVWKSNTTNVAVSSYGTVTAYQSGTAEITGTYKYNERIKIIIALTIE